MNAIVVQAWLGSQVVPQLASGTKAQPWVHACTNHSTALCTDTQSRQWRAHIAAARSSCSSFALRMTSITLLSVKCSAAKGQFQVQLTLRAKSFEGV